jgi:predicted Co/Zn/Cd cation transporter (cation efflux family)
LRLGGNGDVECRMPDTKFRLTGWTMALLAAAAVLIVIAIGWLATGHVKHMLAFLGVAVIALIGAWFTSNPSQRRS